MSEAGWEQQEDCERQRWQLTVDALDAARHGHATEEQIMFLARECGIDPKHITIGHDHAKTQ